MALPHTSITPIPNNEPDAVPALWNTRYSEIDANFVSLDGRAVAAENEIVAARGGQPSIDARLDLVEANVSGTSVDMQNMVGATIKFALDQAALANYGVKALRQQAQQEGEFAIPNKGVVSGCTASKSTAAARNLNLTSGSCFANGRSYSVSDGVNAASVPSNTGASAVTVYAYLYQDAGLLWRLAVTPIGTAVPDNGIRIYNLVVPANSTDATDPNLTNVTLTDVRRIEAQFPLLLDSPASASAVLNNLTANDYRLTFDVVSAVGPPCEAKNLVVYSRADNGFTVLLASAADAVLIRWRASKLNN